MTSIFFKPDNEMTKFIIELSENKTIIDMGCGSGNFMKQLYANGYHKYLGFEPFPDMDDNPVYDPAVTPKILPWASTDDTTKKLLSKINDSTIVFLCRPCHHPELIKGTFDLCQELQIPLYYIGLRKNILEDLTIEGIPYVQIQHKGSSEDDEIILKLNIR